MVNVISDNCHLFLDVGEVLMELDLSPIGFLWLSAANDGGEGESRLRLALKSLMKEREQRRNSDGKEKGKPSKRERKEKPKEKAKGGQPPSANGDAGDAADAVYLTHFSGVSIVNEASSPAFLLHVAEIVIQSHNDQSARHLLLIKLPSVPPLINFNQRYSACLFNRSFTGLFSFVLNYDSFPFSAILSHSQPFSAILSHSQPFSAILGHSAFIAIVILNCDSTPPSALPSAMILSIFFEVL